MNHKSYKILTYILGVFLAAMFSVHADVISIQLGNSSSMTSTTVAGIVPEDNWTNAVGFPEFSGVALDLDDGSPSGATITVDDLNSNSGSHVPATADPNTLMFNRAAVIQPGSGSTFTLNNLPTTGDWAGGYDVYVYFTTSTKIADDGGTDPLDLTLGSTTYYAQLVNGTPNYTGSFTLVDSTNSGARQSGNYVKFSGVSGSSFNLNLAAGATSSQRLAAAGIQIVSIPEPTSLMLVLCSFSGMMLLLRRRS